MAGGVNVADVPMVRGYGRAAASFEQLLLWKPEMIIVQVDHGFAHGTENFAKIMSDPAWQNLDAVRNKKVYEIPSLPFGWFDRPPSVNRVIGLAVAVKSAVSEPDESRYARRNKAILRNCFISKSSATLNARSCWTGRSRIKRLTKAMECKSWNG